MTVWTPVELQTFLDIAAEHHHGPLFRLAARRWGCEPGDVAADETLALRLPHSHIGSLSGFTAVAILPATPVFRPGPVGRGFLLRNGQHHAMRAHLNIGAVPDCVSRSCGHVRVRDSKRHVQEAADSAPPTRR
jgi:hypothetical protein